VLGRRARGRRKKREPGRGHDDKDRPAIIAWVSRQGAVVLQATRDFTVQTVQKAVDLAVHTGSRLYTDTPSSYRALKGYGHAFVNHTHQEYASGNGHENCAARLCSLLKPYLRVLRGLSKTNLSGYRGCFSSCGTSMCRMPSSRPNGSCRQPEIQPLPGGPKRENVSRVLLTLIFYK